MRKAYGSRRLALRPWWVAGLLVALAVARGRAAGRPLTLEETVRLALAHSPALAAAQARLDGAGARVSEAAAGFAPQVSLGGGYTRLDEPLSINGMMVQGASADQYDLRLQLTQLIYTGGALEAGRSAAESGRAAAEAQREGVAQEVAFNAAQAYYGLLTATRLEQIARLGVKAAEAHAAQVQAAYDAGTVLRTDLLQVQLQVGKARQALIKAEHGVALARAGLLSLVGWAPDTEVEVPETAAPPRLEESLDQLTEKALRRRPELLALRQSLEAARAGVEAAQAQRRPTVGAAVSIAGQGSELTDLDGSWTVSLNASLNLFDGGVSAAKIAQAEAGAREAAEALRQTEEGIRLEVRQAYQAVREAEEAEPLALSGQSQARENLELVQLRYEAGLATPVDVTDAQVALAQAEAGYVQAVNDHLLALARLAKATGAPAGQLESAGETREGH